jgi:hypothetical protein
MSGPPALADADEATRIVASESGFLALGETTVVSANDPSSATGSPSCWTSANGRDWRRYDAGILPLESVANTSGGVIAVGLGGDGGGTVIAAVSRGDCTWTSSHVANV